MKVIEFYTEIASAYHDDDDFGYEHLRPFLAALPRGASVLDVGCGPGNQIKVGLEHGLAMHGCDGSSGMIAVAKKRFAQVPFTQSDVRELPFSDRQFDAVICRAVLLHLDAEDGIKVIREIRRSLKPRGRLFLFTTQGAGVGETRHHSLAKDFGLPPIFFFHWDPVALAEAVQDSGFEILKHDKIEFSGAGGLVVSIILAEVPEPKPSHQSDTRLLSTS